MSLPLFVSNLDKYARVHQSFLYCLQLHNAIYPQMYTGVIGSLNETKYCSFVVKKIEAHTTERVLCHP